jgi:hypothetical protein
VKAVTEAQPAPTPARRREAEVAMRRVMLGVGIGMAVGLGFGAAAVAEIMPTRPASNPWLIGPGEQIWGDWRELPTSNVITSTEALPEPTSWAPVEPSPSERVDALGLIRPAQTDWPSLGWYPDVRWPAHELVGLDPREGLRLDPRGLTVPMTTNWP